MSGTQRLLKRLTKKKGRRAAEATKKKHFLSPIWQISQKKKSLGIVNTALIMKEHGHGQGTVWALTLPNGYNEKYSMLIRVGRYGGEKKRNHDHMNVTQILDITHNYLLSAKINSYDTIKAAKMLWRSLMSVHYVYCWWRSTSWKGSGT